MYNFNDEEYDIYINCLIFRHVMDKCYKCGFDKETALSKFAIQACEAIKHQHDKMLEIIANSKSPVHIHFEKLSEE